MKTYIAIICAIGSLLVQSAMGQTDVQVRASVDPEITYLGSALEYTVAVQTVGRHDIEDPQIALPPGLRLVGTSTSFESRQGTVRQPDGTYRLQMVLRRVFTYSLAADRLGELTIDPASVLVDGQTFEANPVTVTVREPKPIDGFSLEARLSKTRVYVGEPFKVYLTWVVGADVRQFGMIGADLPDWVEAEPISPPAAPRDRTGKYPRTGIYGKEIYGTRGETRINGEDVLTVSFEIQYRASKPGTLDLGPISMLYDAIIGRRAKRGVARTGSIVVDVLPLPKAGQPAGFEGLIGSYAVDSTAEPTEVNVGDPITLKVRITGPDSRLVDDGPNLAAQPEYAEHFKFDPGGWERLQGTHTEAVFQTTIRALHADLSEIPSVKVPYFDTESGVYDTAESDPIPLVVRPSKVVTLADAVVSSSLVPQAVEQDLGTPHAGLWAIDSASTLGEVPVLKSVNGTEVFWVVLAGPPIVWLGVFLVGVWTRVRRKDQAIRQRAYKRARNMIRQGKAQDALRWYLAERLGQVPESVTAADCRRAIEDPSLAETVSRWLADDEANRFGSSQEKSPTRREADRVLSTLHKSCLQSTAHSHGLMIIVALLLTLGFSHNATAQSAAGGEQAIGDSPALAVQNAVSLYNKALKLAEHEPAKARSGFADSASVFDSIEQSQPVGAPFYRAQGNAHFFAGDIGRAILAYRRGLRVDPGNRLLEKSLEIARRGVAADSSVSRKTTILDMLTLWQRYVSKGSVFIVFATSWIALWILLIRVRVRHRVPRLITVASIAGVSVVSGVALAGVWLENTASEASVVVVSPAKAFNGPSRSIYDPTFEVPLPAGTEARMVEKRLDWVQLQLPSGTRTWVPEASVEPVHAAGL